MMTRRRIAARVGLVAAIAACGAGGNNTAPDVLAGTYVLSTENGQGLPSDPSAPFGCCLTLAGSVTFAGITYDLRTSHRNKNNGLTFENTEQGRYTHTGNELRFTRTGGGGEGYPYLLGTGVVEGATVTLLYGDEGPGSNQVRAIFRR